MSLAAAPAADMADDEHVGVVKVAGACRLSPRVLRKADIIRNAAPDIADVGGRAPGLRPWSNLSDNGQQVLDVVVRQAEQDIAAAQAQRLVPFLCLGRLDGTPVQLDIVEAPFGELLSV